jgi:hypothetical protein
MADNGNSSNSSNNSSNSGNSGNGNGTGNSKSKFIEQILAHYGNKSASTLDSTDLFIQDETATTVPAGADYTKQNQIKIVKAAEAAQAAIASSSSSSNGNQGPGQGNSQPPEIEPDIQIVIDPVTNLVTFGSDSGKSFGNADVEEEIIPLTFSAPVLASETGSVGDIQAFAESFSTSNEPKKGSSISAALSILPDLEATGDSQAGTSAAEKLGIDALSVMRGYSDSSAQEKELENLLDEMQRAGDLELEDEEDKQQKKEKLKKMEWKDVRLGFTDSEAARQLKTGGFLNPSELQNKLISFRLSFQEGESESQVARAVEQLEKIAVPQDVRFVVTRYLTRSASSSASASASASASSSASASASASPSASASASAREGEQSKRGRNVNIWNVHLRFLDVLAYLLDPDRALYTSAPTNVGTITPSSSGPETNVDSGTGISWAKLFAPKGASETDADFQQRLSMQARALQLLNLLRMKRFSARSIRVFDRRRDGSEYGVLQQKGQETQILASSNLVIDTGGIVTVRTGPLKFNLTETLFNLQQEVRFLHMENARLRSELTDKIYRVFDFAALNQRVLNDVIEKLMEPPASTTGTDGTGTMTNPIISEDFLDPIRQEYAETLAETPAAKAAEIIKEMRKKSTPSYAPTKAELPWGTEDERKQYLEYYIGQVDPDQWEKLGTDPQIFEPIRSKAVSAAEQEKNYLDRVFGVETDAAGTVIEQGFVGLLASKDSLRSPKTSDNQEEAFYYNEAAALAKVLLKRRKETDGGLGFLEKVTRLLKNQLGEKKNLSEFKEFVSTFFGQFLRFTSEGALISSPDANNPSSPIGETGYEAWLQKAKDQVYFKTDEVQYQLAGMNYADFPTLHIDEDTSVNKSETVFSLRMHTEDNYGTVPNVDEAKRYWTQVHPKSAASRIVATSILETVRIFDSLKNSATNNLKIPAMDTKNGQKYEVQPGSATGGATPPLEVTPNECFDVLLVSLKTIATDQPKKNPDGSEYLIENNNSNTDNTEGKISPEGTEFGFCDRSGDNESILVFNSSKIQGLLVNEDGKWQNVPVIATAVHEFMHAVQNSNFGSSRSRIVHEGFATMSELFCFDTVVEKMFSNYKELSGIVSELEKKRIIDHYVQCEAGSTWNDYNSTGDATKLVFDSKLEFMDEVAEIDQSITNIDVYAYKHFLLFAMIAAMVTRTSTEPHKELAWVLQFYKELQSTTSAPKASEALIAACGISGSTFTEPVGFEASITLEEAKNWNNTKKLRYIQHCAKCHLVKLSYASLNGIDLNDASTSNVIRTMFETSTENEIINAGLKVRQYLSQNESTHLLDAPGDSTDVFSSSVTVLTAAETSETKHIHTSFD